MAEINVGQISEALNDKADRDLNNVTPYLQKRYVSNGIVVEIWSDGYCVQSGGTTWSTSITSTGVNIVYPQPYINNNYTIFLSMGRSDGWTNGGQVQWNSTTATGFRIWGQDIQGIHWVVRGYIR